MTHRSPAPPGKRLALRLHPRAERAVKRGHPWVFAEGISQQRQEGRAGDLAVVFDDANRFLAIGLYDPGSPIRVRILHRGAPTTIDGAWIAARIRGAYDARVELAEQGTTGFRMVHGENDGLPGLVLDRYGASVVVKLYTAAWLPWLADVAAAVVEPLQPERLVLRLSRAVARAGSGTAGVADGHVLHGPPLDGPVLFTENGLTFESDLLRGQKTGFFLDQRDNRARVERLSRGRSVLNIFSYTGGFSVYAARGGARAVTSVDLSAPALEAAERNFHHNRAIPAVAAARHRVIAGDAFDAVPALRDRGERFDIVIVDPPSFAKAQAEVERALGSYARIIRRGMDVLVDGGVLVAASCSSRITLEQFREVVHDTARKAGRALEVLEETGHPLDHPIGFPEGAYLKCIFAQVRVLPGA